MTLPLRTSCAAAMMSSGDVKFRVPISSSGPHLPQFLYFSEASRRSWRESFLSAIGLPFPKGRGGEAFRFLLVLRGRLADDSINKTIRESLMMPIARILAVLVALASSAAPSLAQTYPDRSVRVVVGFAAGGPTDVIARIVAQKLSANLHLQFYVENVGGAGGNTAAGQVAKATPDGYTIHVVSTGFVVNPSLYAKVPYDPIRDFAPVTLVAVSPNVLVVNPAVPAKSIPELVQLIRDNPGKYAFDRPGVGSTPHLSGELFKLSFELD